MKRKTTKSPPTLEQRVVLAEMDQRIATLESMVLTLNKKHEELVEATTDALGHKASHENAKAWCATINQRLDKLEEYSIQTKSALTETIERVFSMDVRITRLRDEKDGKRVIIRCSECDTDVQEDDKYCRHCGEEFAAPTIIKARIYKIHTAKRR